MYTFKEYLENVANYNISLDNHEHLPYVADDVMERGNYTEFYQHIAQIVENAVEYLRNNHFHHDERDTPRFYAVASAISDLQQVRNSVLLVGKAFTSGKKNEIQAELNSLHQALQDYNDTLNGGAAHVFSQDTQAYLQKVQSFLNSLEKTVRNLWLN